MTTLNEKEFAMSTRVRVEFRLSMPSTGSGNGKWTGTGRNYTLVRTLSAERVRELGIPTSWRHAWDDGWAACVSARIMKRGERKAKSDGFCGYAWMVENIIRWGSTECRHEWAPDPDSGRPGWEGEWERCINCRSSRKVAEAKPEPVAAPE